MKAVLYVLYVLCIGQKIIVTESNSCLVAKILEKMKALYKKM